VADSAVVAFAALELVRHDFRGLVFFFKNFGGDFGALHKRGADFHTGVIGSEEHFVECCFFAGLDVEQLDIDHVAGLHAELTTAGLDDCVSHNFAERVVKITATIGGWQEIFRGNPATHFGLPALQRTATMHLLMKYVLVLFALAFAGCATTQQSPVDPKIVDAFSSRGVSSATVFKVREGLPLSVNQVAESAEKGVPGPGLVSYMQSTRKAYNLSNADIAKLRSAGTPAPVIDYMRRSYSLYGKGPNAVDQGHPYFSGENYNRYGGNVNAPFAYAPPQADTFFNSAYEENLYSPFSFQ